MLRNFFSYRPSPWSKNRVKDFEKSEIFKISKSVFSKNMNFKVTFLVRRSVPSTLCTLRCFDPSSYKCLRWTNQLDHHLSRILRGGATGADWFRKWNHSNTNAGWFVFDYGNSLSEKRSTEPGGGGGRYFHHESTSCWISQHLCTALTRFTPHPRCFRSGLCLHRLKELDAPRTQPVFVRWTLETPPP